MFHKFGPFISTSLGRKPARHLAMILKHFRKSTFEKRIKKKGENITIIIVIDVFCDFIFSQGNARYIGSAI